ncbi:unnamed protein product [Mytilus coruscus]|uniref:Ig-like domain-containing protein n=1 Tax=Mytilus coruscus TaxID=42192 RepID=A0A6J8EL88_MYTCO|nr:unnamed protein product [Mytilus coruscus]
MVGPRIELKHPNCCQSGASRLVCAIKGSSPILTFITNHKLNHNGNDIDFLKRTNIRKDSNFTRHVDLQIYKVTPDHEGNYDCRIDAPAVTGRHTNDTVERDCDGNPAIYSVYRLDQISNHGELVRSVNLNNGTLRLQTDPYLYQRNGRYMCVVSNGISDTNGEILQTWSTNVKYEVRCHQQNDNCLFPIKATEISKKRKLCQNCGESFVPRYFETHKLKIFQENKWLYGKSCKTDSKDTESAQVFDVLESSDSNEPLGLEIKRHLRTELKRHRIDHNQTESDDDEDEDEELWSGISLSDIDGDFILAEEGRDQ